MHPYQLVLMIYPCILNHRRFANEFVDSAASDSKPIRREDSAPPIILSLVVDEPVFDEPPAGIGESSEQRPTMTVSLGSFAEFNRIMSNSSCYLDILCILNYSQAALQVVIVFCTV